jgi:hypothetical protein
VRQRRVAENVVEPSQVENEISTLPPVTRRPCSRPRRAIVVD